MSRSVMMPSGLRATRSPTTGSAPQSCSTISRVASAIDVSGVQHAGALVMTSRTRMVSLLCAGLARVHHVGCPRRAAAPGEPLVAELGRLVRVFRIAHVAAFDPERRSTLDASGGVSALIQAVVLDRSLRRFFRHGFSCNGL